MILLIFLGTIFQNVAMFRTGMLYQYGVGYFGPLARDGVWHEALVNQLKLSVPPINPGFAGQTLSNYHYFYDILVAKTSLFTKLSPPVLIYQIFPIIFSILLGVGTYFLAQRLFKNKFVSFLAVFFAYFGSSFGWIIDVVKHREIGGESAFWANQPISMNINPPYAISLVLMVFGILLLDSYLKKSGFVKGFVLSIVFGTLIGFKAYAGAIVIAALFVLTIKRALMDKSYSLIPIFLGVSIIFMTIYYFVSRGGIGLIGFQPLWLIDTMIDAGDRVGIANLTARRFAYLGGHRYLFYAGVELISLIIFFVGNLGTRIVSVWGIRKKFIKDDLHIFVFLLMMTAVIPTLLFVQKGNPWNIIQFFYYFLYLAGLYAAYALSKSPILILAAILILTPISSLAVFHGNVYPTPPAYLPTGELAALRFLSTKPPGTVLKHPFDLSLKAKFKDPFPLAVYADNAYVSAFSSHPVFIEDAEQQTILDTDFQNRVDAANRFFVEKNLNWSKMFLLDNNIRYIYLPKIYHLPMAEQEYPMKKIFENNDANIYQVDGNL